MKTPTRDERLKDLLDQVEGIRPIITNVIDGNHKLEPHGIICVLQGALNQMDAMRSELYLMLSDGV